MEFSLPVLGFAGYSGAGKTTLLTRLLPRLRAAGLRCGVVKHSHHDIELDVPGKDSHRLREAGAAQLLLASPHRSYWVEEGDGATEPDLVDVIARFEPSRLDLVMVEGFRDSAIPKIEVHRPALGKPLLCVDDANVLAIASDTEPEVPLTIPRLPLDDVDAIAVFVSTWLRSR